MKTKNKKTTVVKVDKKEKYSPITWDLTVKVKCKEQLMAALQYCSEQDFMNFSYEVGQEGREYIYMLTIHAYSWADNLKCLAEFLYENCETIAFRD